MTQTAPVHSRTTTLPAAPLSRAQMRRLATVRAGDKQRELQAREDASRSRTPSQRAQSPSEELELIDALLLGDAAAWRKFSQLYSKVALGCIRRVLCRFKVTDENDAEEIYARLSLELLRHDCKKLRRFDASRGCRLSTWIGMLATNCTYDYLRKVKRDSVCDALPEGFELPSFERSPFEEVALQQRAAVAAKVMRSLSAREQEFVELYFAEGLTADEVAAEMGISLKTVYTKKHKLIAKLENLLVRDAKLSLVASAQG